MTLSQSGENDLRSHHMNEGNLKTERTNQQPQSSARDFSHAWRALTHRKFRLFFGGQTISLIGNWMTRIATGWLVYRLTGSALLLGLVGFAGRVPTVFLS